MNSRRTSDYSPTKPGSREENQAINARREMIAILGQRMPDTKGIRKNHDRRVQNNYNVMMAKIRKEEEALKAAKAA